MTVDMIADKVTALGTETLVAKLDIKSAFRIVPVHPSDRVLLGMQWQDSWYVDMVLPFGLQRYSTPLPMSSSIWHMPKEPSTSHYLDDYVILGQPDTDQCQKDLGRLVGLCDRLGIPLAEKAQFDAITMQLSLPKHKRIELSNLLQARQGRNVVTKREVQSIAGKLQHAW